jgi:hypothetical protein
MIADTNSVIGFSSLILGNLLGSNSLVLLGIVIFMAIAVALIWAKMKIGTSVMIGSIVAVMLSFFIPEFGFLFWLGILVSLVMLVNGLRKFWGGY